MQPKARFGRFSLVFCLLLLLIPPLFIIYYAVRVDNQRFIDYNEWRARSVARDFAFIGNETGLLEAEALNYLLTSYYKGNQGLKINYGLIATESLHSKWAFMRKTRYLAHIDKNRVGDLLNKAADRDVVNRLKSMKTAFEKRGLKAQDINWIGVSELEIISPLVYQNTRFGGIIYLRVPTVKLSTGIGGFELVFAGLIYLLNVILLILFRWSVRPLSPRPLKVLLFLAVLIIIGGVYLKTAGDMIVLGGFSARSQKENRRDILFIKAKETGFSYSLLLPIVKASIKDFAQFTSQYGENLLTDIKRVGDKDFRSCDPGSYCIVAHKLKFIYDQKQWDRVQNNIQTRYAVWMGILLLVLLFLLILIFRGVFDRLGAVLNENLSAYAYLTPAMVSMIVLVFVPFFYGFGLSVFKYVNGEYSYVGLDNFISILSASEYSLLHPYNFYFKLGVTILWTVTNVFLHVVIGLSLALILQNPFLKLKGIYRVLLIVPWAIPNYITALTWKLMFNEQEGIINYLLMTVLNLPRISWFSSFSTAFTANLITNTWLGFPFMMVVSLGALQSIPRELYEAAQVDGASAWQQFKNITLPLLKPALFPAIILGMIWTFNMFNIIYLVSQGQPDGTTDILITEAYKWAFERKSRYGYAAAYSVIIFFILFIYSTITNRITRATKGALE